MQMVRKISKKDVNMQMNRRKEYNNPIKARHTYTRDYGEIITILHLDTGDGKIMAAR